MNSNKDPEKFFPDPDIFNPSISPILIPENHLQGFVNADFWTSMAVGRQATEAPFFEDPELKVLKTLFDTFCQKMNHTSHNYKQAPVSFRIPPIIHFIWLGSPLPNEAQVVIDTWRRCHSGWDIKLWSDAEVENFPWSNGYVKLAFRDARDWSEKADILRYEILYHFGGVYADLDTICFKSFNDLISNDISFFAGLVENKVIDGRILQLNNAVIGAEKNNSIIKYCLDNLILEAESPEEWISSRTGPLLLTRACQDALKTINTAEMLILPCGYFYPLPLIHFWANRALTAEQIREHYVSSESMIIHLWANSWAFSIIQGRSKEEFDNFLAYNLKNSSQ